MRNQRTLRNAFVLHGIEPYGGCEVQFIMSPAPKDTGRVFQTKKGSVQAD